MNKQNTIWRRALGCCGLGLALLWAAALAAETPPPGPSAAMQAVVDELVLVVKEQAGEKNTEKRRVAMRAIIDPRFDFEEMSRRSLGTLWNDISAQQRADFVSLFASLLAKTYLNRVEHIEAGMVELRGERVSGPRALVRTQVQYRSDSFPLDYRLLLGPDGGWKVYDVVIENIGLISNYRHEFAGIARRQGFDGLYKSLQEKLQKE